MGSMLSALLLRMRFKSGLIAAPRKDLRDRVSAYRCQICPLLIRSNGTSTNARRGLVTHVLRVVLVVNVVSSTLRITFVITRLRKGFVSVVRVCC